MDGWERELTSITVPEGIYMSHIHWVARQNKLEISRDKDEVKK
jgi:hypothetical protein